ncbi:MAG: hypothetical protein EZS28_010751, partial [Streblomastix strix]
MDSAKTRALKNKEWRENMIPPKEILQELYWWHGVIVRNQEMPLEVKILEAVMVSDASPKSWGVTLELQTGDTLVQYGEWNKEQKRWTSNKIEMEAIFLGLFRYGQVFKELQIKAILIKSDSSTAAKYSGRLFSKEKSIHSLVRSVVDNTDTGLIRNRGKQTRGQILGNRSGRGRGRIVKRIFETMDGGDLQ